MGEIRTNIIYLTTHCNLDCSYCYERDSRNADGFVHRTATSQDIDAFIEEVREREGDYSSCVVIFGGEPLLRMDLVTELLDKFIERKPKASFDLITNGTLITEEVAHTLKSYYDKLQSIGSHLQIEVSYDGKGQSLRTYVNGADSNDQVLLGIGLLVKHEVPFALSYTVTPMNHASVLEDVIYFIMKYKPSKVSLRWAVSHLERAGVDTETLKAGLTPKFAVLFNRFRIPICELVCSVCQYCSKSTAGNNYFIPETGLYKAPTYVEKGFHHFNRS